LYSTPGATFIRKIDNTVECRRVKREDTWFYRAPEEGRTKIMGEVVWRQL
jgi:hypothetical protein